MLREREAKHGIRKLIAPIILASALITPHIVEASASHTMQKPVPSFLGDEATNGTLAVKEIYQTSTTTPNGEIIKDIALTPKPNNKGFMLSISEPNPQTGIREPYKVVNRNIPPINVQNIVALNNKTIMITGYTEDTRNPEEVGPLPQLLISRNGGKTFKRDNFTDDQGFIAVHMTPYEHYALLNFGAPDGGGEQSWGIYDDQTNKTYISPETGYDATTDAIGKGPKKNTLEVFAQAVGDGTTILDEITIDLAKPKVYQAKPINYNFTLQNPVGMTDPKTGAVTAIMGTETGPKGNVKIEVYNLAKKKFTQQIPLEQKINVAGVQSFDINGLAEQDGQVVITGSENPRGYPFIAEFPLTETNKTNKPAILDDPESQGLLTEPTFTFYGKQQGIKALETTEGIIFIPMNRNKNFVISTLSEALRPDNGLPSIKFTK